MVMKVGWSGGSMRTAVYAPSINVGEPVWLDRRCVFGVTSDALISLLVHRPSPNLYQLMNLKQGGQGISCQVTFHKLH